MNEKVRELMALADKYAEAKAQVAVYGFSDVQKRRAALEQAIRRAVDWGEPVATVVKRVNFMTGEGRIAAELHVGADVPPRTPLYARRQDQ